MPRGEVYGDQDTLTPPDAGRYLRQQMPHAELAIFPAEGHLAAFTHWDEIVATLTR